MTKAGLVRLLHEQGGELTKVRAAELIDTVIDVLKQRMACGERVLITNFGSFQALDRKERRGRNPKTGRIIPIRPRRTVVFRSAQRLDGTLNRPSGSSQPPAPETRGSGQAPLTHRSTAGL